MSCLPKTTFHGAILASILLSCLTTAPTFAAASPRPTLLAASALGDLSAYRAIAADTLTIVSKGDVPAARTRIKDLETSWDKAEASSKPKDKMTWRTLDTMIDAALADIRTPSPKLTDCAASLKALIAKLDAVQTAGAVREHRAIA